MKLQKAIIRNVRHLKRLELEFQSPLAVVSAPNGAAKTTVQKSILATLFLCKKEVRDSLISCYDPDTPPTVTMNLSRGADEPSITLTRRLTDDTGEWTEGASVVRQKGKALEKVHAELPISDAAAAMLLWGNQEDMTAVLDAFPTDGHSILTAATIKGAGPDPKEFVEELEAGLRSAKRTGKNAGPLTKAEERVGALEEEREQATAAHKKQTTLLESYNLAKAAREQARLEQSRLAAGVKTLAAQSKLLQACLHAARKLSGLTEQETEWDGLADAINKNRRDVKALQDELAILQSQYRVARDHELTARIAEVTVQVEEVQDVDKLRAGIDQDLAKTKRPGKDELKQFHRFQGEAKESSDKMDATGVRYQVEVDAGSAKKSVRVAEDNGDFRQLDLAPGNPHASVVGTVVIMSEGLRLTASGKEDVGSHKRHLQKASTEIQALWKRFGVCIEEDFLALAADKERLEADLRDARSALEKSLKGESLVALRSRLAKLQAQQAENPPTSADELAWGNKPLASPMEIERKALVKQTQVENAVESGQALSEGQPDADQRTRLVVDLQDARQLARSTEEAFRNADATDADPAVALLEQIDIELENQREQLNSVQEGFRKAEADVIRRDTELKFSGPRRTVAVVEAELEEARQGLWLEQVQQKARQLLKEQLQSTISEMAADVPQSLAKKISDHLARLTRRAYKEVRLTENLNVERVTDSSPFPVAWKPAQLSNGEQRQLALVVKIAVARALAEINGPVFLILDDSLDSFDPDRRAETEALLLDLVADGKLQVILFTCHSDWAADWKKRVGDRLQHIELNDVAEFYVTRSR
jgi:DNA repair exonuclease SbcCD ATPase subunit